MVRKRSDGELTFFWSLWVALAVVLVAGLSVGFFKYQSLLMTLNQQNDLITNLNAKVEKLEGSKTVDIPVSTNHQPPELLNKRHDEIKNRLKAELQKELRVMRRVLDREMTKFTKLEDLSKMRQQILSIERKILSIDISVSNIEGRIRSKLHKAMETRLSSFESNLTETIFSQPVDNCISTKIGKDLP